METSLFAIDLLFERILTRKLPYKAGDLKGRRDETYCLPATTASTQNQGLTSYVPRDGATVLRGVISMSANGNPAVYYQPGEFTVLQDSYAIKPKHSYIGSGAMLYLVTAIRKVIEGNFSWTDKPGWEKVRTREIELPVRKAYAPDWDALAEIVSGGGGASMSSIDTSTWHEFTIGELFDVESTWEYGRNKQWKTRFDTPSDGRIPVVSGTTINNGVRYFTADEPSEDDIHSDCLTMTTRGESGMVFYHDGPFLLANNILTMPMPGIPRAAQLFIGAALQKQFHSNDYSIYPTKDLLTEAIILLPATETIEPDYGYMERYIAELEAERVAELEAERVAELEAYLEITGLENYELTDEDKKVLESEHEFGEFEIGNLFNVKKGKRLTKADMLPGQTAFISATARNNGITARIGNTGHIHPKHTITVSYDGSVGEVFYQDEPFWALDDINVMYPVASSLTAETMLYLVAVIKPLRAKYSYTHKWIKAALEKDVIKLPVTPDGTPDYAYMAAYIRAMEKVTIRDAVLLKGRIIEETRRVVEADSSDDACHQHEADASS